MSVLDSNYKLTRTKGSCFECGSDFENGELYISTLKGYVESGDSEDIWERCDFCEQCWKTRETQNFFSHWQTRKKTEGKNEEKLDIDSVLGFFRSLEGKTDALSAKLRYVLSLYLTRKKLLDLVDVQLNEDSEFLVFKYPEKEDKFSVENPGLSEDEAGELKATLLQIFGSAKSQL